MSFADDLLEQAYDLANKSGNPKQASLRRAVSAAYYALFHLLIDEAVNKWAVERQRGLLARTFDHHKMKATCSGVLKTATGTTVSPEIVVVARNFIGLQEHRHEADYDIAKQWSRTDVLNALALASEAFTAWRAVSHLDSAQDFLLQLFLPKPPRQ